VLWGNGDSHGVAWACLLAHGGVIVNIYSCLRRLFSYLKVSIVKPSLSERLWLLDEKFFPAPECTIVFVVTCLAFRFVSPLVTRLVSLSLSSSVHLYYRKNLNNWTVCYVVRNSLLWKGGKKHSKNTAPFPPLRQKKKQKFLDHTRRGKSNDIAHRPIIQVFTVVEVTISN